MMPNQPHTCPVCDGRGYVWTQYAWERYSIVSTRCHACNGKGIVWQPVHAIPAPTTVIEWPLQTTTLPEYEITTRPPCEFTT